MRKDQIFPLVCTTIISQLIRALPIFFLLLGLPLLSRAELPLHLIKLPPEFTISVYAENVAGARSMTLSPTGTLFVGSLRAGNVYAIVDRNQDNKADKVSLIAQGLNAPNGVAFRDGALYVAEINRILRFDNIEERLENPPQPVVVNDTLPSDRHHGWKFIKFGPDGLLYVPVGGPCNVCERDDERYAALLRMNPEGSGLEVFARGIRNTVGFDWHPDTQVLWFTDNGRDMLGDDTPPDELNYASEKGMHFGFPYCHGGDIPDPQFGEKRKCDEFTPPALRLGPHVAAIGMRFYTGSMFPLEYRKQIFIAEHGSWNRRTPLGYRISLARFVDSGAMKYDIFAEGWLRDGGIWGRPVDLQVMTDGALLVSDDFADAVYRISYTK
jgi:glucose/arabinose dehydrogenase